MQALGSIFALATLAVENNKVNFRSILPAGLSESLFEAYSWRHKFGPVRDVCTTFNLLE